MGNLSIAYGAVLQDLEDRYYTDITNVKMKKMIKFLEDTRKQVEKEHQKFYVQNESRLEEQYVGTSR
jgi:hypothetical protein